MSAGDAAKVATSTNAFNASLPGFDGTTSTSLAVQATTLAMSRNGVATISVNASASSTNGAIWAVWSLQTFVAVRANGTLSIVVPTSPFAIAPSSSSGGTASGWRLQASTAGDTVVISVKGSDDLDVKWSLRAAAVYNSAS